MYEVGLELKLKQGKIIFSYRANDYEIRSHPYEPCTYICKEDTILHTLRNGFEVSQIEKMILRDKQFKSVTGSMIGYELLRDILACVIDDGRPELTFDYAEQLGEKRRTDRQEYQKELDDLHRKERQERLVCLANGNRMKKYIFRGETKRNFYLAFTKAHNLSEYHRRIGEEEFEKPNEPMGIIIVPKDYENEWIAERENYLDWRVVVAPVASQFVKGFNAPHWKVLKDNTDAEISGYKYVIYQNPEGKIVGDTVLTDLDIANSLEEYEAMSAEQIESMCYRCEMSRAR